MMICSNSLANRLTRFPRKTRLDYGTDSRIIFHSFSYYTITTTMTTRRMQDSTVSVCDTFRLKKGLFSTLNTKPTPRDFSGFSVCGNENWICGENGHTSSCSMFRKKIQNFRCANDLFFKNSDRSDFSLQKLIRFFRIF